MVASFGFSARYPFSNQDFAQRVEWV